MNIELKNVKIHPDMSEETNCFSATIYVNGNSVGTVRNDGRGGCNMYHFTDRDAGKRLEEYAKATVTDYNFEQLDHVIDKLLNNQEILRWLKRNTKGKTLFRLPGDKKAEWRIVKAPFTPNVKTFILNNYPTVECIANENMEAATAYC